MFFHGAEKEAPIDDKPVHDEGQQGDGLHHHEIHEDEGGGFHSKHTHPDGTEEHDDHTTYEEARDKMDSDFDKSDGDDSDSGDDDQGDMDSGDIAGSYGRKACE
jgi:hypothetical protein